MLYVSGVVIGNKAIVNVILMYDLIRTVSDNTTYLNCIINFDQQIDMHSDIIYIIQINYWMKGERSRVQSFRSCEKWESVAKPED